MNYLEQYVLSVGFFGDFHKLIKFALPGSQFSGRFVYL